MSRGKEGMMRCGLMVVQSMERVGNSWKIGGIDSPPFLSVSSLRQDRIRTVDLWHPRARVRARGLEPAASHQCVLLRVNLNPTEGLVVDKKRRKS